MNKCKQKNTNTLFIEYKGNLYTNKEDSSLDIHDLFIIAKNKDIPNINQLLHIVKAHVHYECIYHDEIMKKIKPLIPYYSSST